MEHICTMHARKNTAKIKQTETSWIGKNVKNLKMWIKREDQKRCFGDSFLSVQDFSHSN